MLSEYSSGNNSTELESDIFDISESFVRSDIAEIISKMYTPLPQWTGDAGREGNSDSSKEMARENPKKRFGFYFESISANNNLEISRDSSTSDMVSLPSVKTQEKHRNGFVCKCCKRHILHRISEKRKKNACPNCKRKYVDKDEIGKCRLKDLELEIPENCKQEQTELEVLKMCTNNVCQVRDIQNNLQKRETNSAAEMCADSGNLARKSITVQEDVRIPCGVDQGGSSLLSRILNYSQHHNTEENMTLKKCSVTDESFQVVPQLGEGDQKKTDVQVRVDNAHSKVENITIFKRLFTSSWPSIFNRKTKCVTNETHNTNEVIENVITDLEISERRELKSLVKQTQNFEIPQCSKNTPPYDFNTIVVEKSKMCHTPSFQKSTLINIEEEVPFSQKYQVVPLTKGNEVENTNVQSHKSISINNDPKLVNFCQDTNTVKSANQTEQKPTKRKVRVIEFFNKIFQTDAQFTMFEGWAMFFWGNVFSIFHEAVSFFTSFALQLLKFVLVSVVHPILWGTTQVISEHFFQPCLRTTYENLIKPIFTMIQNIAESFRDFSKPVAQSLGYFIVECSSICRACRLVDIQHVHQVCKCNNNP